MSVTLATLNKQGVLDSDVEGQINANFAALNAATAATGNFAGSVSVGTTLAVTGATTLTGAVTLTGGVTGAVAATGALSGTGLIVTPTVLSGATDALTYPGVSVLTRAGVDACTLATPTPGTDDGKILTVVSTTAFAHTITTAANKIAGGGTTAFGDTLTFAAKQGASCTLLSYGGIWYVLALVNVTLSEV